MSRNETGSNEGKDGLSALREKILKLETQNQDLKDSEERFRKLFEHAPDGYYLSTLAGVFVDGNAVAESMTGYARSELIGKNYLTLGLLSAKDALRAGTLLARNMLGQSTGPDTFAITRKDGSLIPTEITTHPVKIAGQRLVLGIARDISERHRMERELRERVKELQAFYRLSEIAEENGGSLSELCKALADALPRSWLHDEIACARIMLRDEEYRSKTFAESRWKQRANIRVAGRAVGAVDVYYLEERPDEDEGPFLSEERRLIDAIAERLGRIVERKDAEDALRASELRYHTLFEESQDAIALAEAETGMILDCNAAMCRMTGREKSELVGQRQTIQHAPSDERGQVTDGFHNARNAPPGHPIEDVVVSKDGLKIPVEIRAATVEIAGRTCLLGIFRDVTERKRSEQALARSLSLLAESQRLAHVGSWELDLEEQRLIWSDEVYRILGLVPRESPASYETYLALVHPEDRDAVDGLYRDSLRKRLDSYSEDHRLVRPDTGEIRYVHEECIHERSPNGTVIRSVGIIQDITDRKRAEDYRAVASDVLAILNRQEPIEGLLVEAIAAVRTRTGVDAVGLRLQEAEDYPYFAQIGFDERFVAAESSLVDHDPNHAICRDIASNVSLACVCGQVIAGRGRAADPHFTRRGSWWSNNTSTLLEILPDEDLRHRPRNRCIHEGYASLALIPVRSADRTVGLLQLNARRGGFFNIEAIEILEGAAAHIAEALARRDFEAELARMARHDALTGVLNRYGLKEPLEREVARAQRYDRPIGFLMIDVNRFKEINDRFGHAMGDRVLRGIADVLRHNVRETDLLVRYGGDEFLVILPETNGETELVKDRIIAEVSSRNRANPLLDFPVTLAIGTVHWSPASKRNIDQTLEEADRRMYRDKRQSTA